MRSFFNEIFDYWYQFVVFFNEWYGLILLIIPFVATLVCFTKLKSNINKKSIAEINKNDGRKYIDDLYVELGQGQELLRYFINKKKWFERLKFKCYLLFNNYLGKLLYKYTGIKFGIFNSNRIVSNNMDKMKNALVEIRKKNYYQVDNLGTFLQHNIYGHIYTLTDLVTIRNVLSKRVCIIIGNAGCGKTNLMTKISKTIIDSYKEQCIYINAKSIIDNNIEKKFNEFFYTKIIITEDSSKRINYYLSLLSCTTEKIFVIIEAINENENQNFMMELVSFINKYSKYKCLNFILTTRAEFFELKYENVISDHLLPDYELIKISNVQFNELALDRMMKKYKKYYNFSGKINDNVKKMLYKSPILIRMFFECYQNSSEVITELTSFQLFNYYMENIKRKYSEIDIWNILYEIVEKMIESDKYDYIKYNELERRQEISNTLIYENVLLDKSIIENEAQITQEACEIISFTYDEMRDFIISKYLLKNYTNKKKLIAFLTKCKEKKKNILEGILKYIYYHFQNMDDFEMAQIILNNFAKGNYIFPRKNENDFTDLGLEIIFLQYQPLKDFEIDYILNNSFDSYETSLIFFNLVRNTLYNLQPDASIIISEIEKELSDSDYYSNLLSLDTDFYYNLLKNIKDFNKSLNENSKKLITYLEIWLNTKNGGGEI